MYEKLKEIQLLLWQNDDHMTQSQIFEIQSLMADLIYEYALRNKIENQIVIDFPWIYKKIK